MMTSDLAAIRFQSWNDLFTFGRGLANWIFRGQAQADWHLKTSLERALGASPASSWKWQHTERWMLRKFQGFAHHYLMQLPSRRDSLEWLAIMQHHGSPTRLLDCTASFPVAAFFAAREGEADFAVWAFNFTRFMQGVARRLNITVNPSVGALAFHDAMHAKANEFLAGKASGALSFPILPRRSNERVEAQQGLFLFPCDVDRSMEENLACLVGTPDISYIHDPANVVPYDPVSHQPGLLGNHWMLKLILASDDRFTVMRDLRRINIHEATLFPGLDGFARSLREFARWS